MKENEWKCPVKPEDIPTYLNWVAQDMDGDWFGYTTEPVIDSEFLMWTDNSNFTQQDGDYLCRSEYNANWRNTLKKIPR
jgi:hypothetical protein